MRKWTRRDLVKAGAAVGAASITANGLAAEGVASEREAAAQAKAHQDEVRVDVVKNTLREQLSLDFGWRFALGNACDPMRDFGFGKLAGTGTYAKSGDAGGATGVHFDDSKWEAVQVPHDWAVALPFVIEPILVGHGGKPVGRDFPESSIGWYRREIEVKPEDEGKRMVLEFDGVYRNATVFVNGHWVGENLSGYVPFEIDVTDFLDYSPREVRGPDGKTRPESGPVKNVVTLRVDATLSDGWFYEGAGVYRHVWLRKTGALHLVKDGVFVQTSPSAGGDAGLAITSEVKNAGGCSCTLFCDWGRGGGREWEGGRAVPVGGGDGGAGRDGRRADDGEDCGGEDVESGGTEPLPAGDGGGVGGEGGRPGRDTVRRAYDCVGRPARVSAEWASGEDQRDVQSPGPCGCRRGGAGRDPAIQNRAVEGHELQWIANDAQHARCRGAGRLR